MTNISLLGAYGGYTGDGLMFRNVLINGNFDVWQRATTGTSTGTALRVADRWVSSVVATNPNYTCSQSTDVPNLSSSYSLSWTQTTGQNATSLTDYCLRQVIEKQNTLGLVGKPITVSFWYKSNVTGTHGVRIIGNSSGYTGGADQNQAFTVNSANTWEYKTLTFTSIQNVTAVTGDMTGIGMYLDIGPRVGGGTSSIGQTSFNGDSYFRISQAQLEAGPVATPFERRPYPIELDLCERYYREIDVNGTPVNMYPGTNNGYFNISHKEMRIIPTPTFDTTYQNSGVIYFNSTSVAATFAVNANATKTGQSIRAVRTSGNFAAGEVCGHVYLRLKLNAEL